MSEPFGFDKSNPYNIIIMLKIRIFPCLLLKDQGLVKTVQFKNPTYIGDPINAVRIFNTKQVDELLLLDITATSQNKRVNLPLIEKIAKECYMPLTVGGAIQSLDDIQAVLNAGAEKVAINSAAINNPALIKQASDKFGSQAMIVSMDVKKDSKGDYAVYSHCHEKILPLDPIAFAQKMQQAGAGEILINAVDQDGMMQGYDLDMVKSITTRVNIPVIACGGCGHVEDFTKVIVDAGAAAAAAGSLFVYHGKRRAVLINFPDKDELEAVI